MVGRPEVQQLLGAAISEGKRAIFFAASGYTAKAIDFADRNSVALFVYDAIGGKLAAINGAATAVLRADSR